LLSSVPASSAESSAEHWQALIGEDEEALVDALFQVWIALALKQGRGRHLALRLIER